MRVEILTYLISFFTDYGYISVFAVLVICGFGVPVPEDVTLIAGGVICAFSADATSPLSLRTMCVVALFGVLFGDSIMFTIGRVLGARVTKVKGLKFIITPENYEKIQEKAHKYGDKILFLARFLPGLRAPLFLVAGVSHKVPFWKFILMDGLAALISVPTLVYLGYFFANDLDIVLGWVKQSESIIIGLIIIFGVVFFLFKLYKKRKNHT